jgi:hypothetical protein
MIKKRLVQVVPDSKKYIAGNVMFQWIALISNIVLMTSTVFINLNSQNTINSKNVLISMLSTLLSDKIKADEKKQKLEKEYGIKMSKELESEVSSMCNLSEAIEERGIERGRMYTIYDFIQSGMITPEAGAQKLGISVEQLKEDMEAAGYHFPD